jgi:hypothetical protein
MPFQRQKRKSLYLPCFYKHRYRKMKNRLLKFCYVPATSAARNRLLFVLFLLWPFTVLMKQTRQAVRAIKQSIFLDVYVHKHLDIVYFQIPVLDRIYRLRRMDLVD